MKQEGLREILFKSSKITKFASSTGLVDMNNHLVLQAELAQELAKLVDVYRYLRINNKHQIALCIFLVMVLTLSLKLSYSLMLLTLLFVTATLVYLTITQQETVQTLQKNVFKICYKSLSSSLGDVVPQSEDSGAEEQ